MSRNIPAISAVDARRLLLQAQGLLADPSRPATPRELARLINQMGLVQVDTINVVDRAHHLTIFSRLHRYERKTLAHLLERSRVVFEHWTHDASIIPVEWFPHWHHRFRQYEKRVRSNKWWQARIGADPDALIARVLERIAKDGPLLSRDFEHDWNGAAKPEDGWWGWKPQKAALEHLWRSGKLAIARRENFQKVYDLTERVLTSHAHLPPSDEAEHIDWACRTALERLVIATPAEIAAFWRAISLQQVRNWGRDALARGEIISVNVGAADPTREKPRPALALADLHNRLKAVSRIEPNANLIRILSPFDPVIRDRKRTQRLFAFDYAFEAFVPEPKRRYGYYVMPLLEGDRLVGRINPKLHRDRKTLEIKGLWWEKNIKATRQRKRNLGHAIERLASFLGADEIDLAIND